jgi:hypothetical protein
MNLQFISNLYLTPFVLKNLETLARMKQRSRTSLQAQQTRVPKTPEGLARKQKYIQKYKKQFASVEKKLSAYQFVIEEMLTEIHTIMPALLNYIQREQDGLSKIQLLFWSDAQYKDYMDANPLIQSYKGVTNPMEIPEWIHINLNAQQLELFKQALQDRDIDGMEQIEKMDPPSDSEKFLAYLKIVKPIFYNDVMSQKLFRQENGQTMTLQQMKIFGQNLLKQSKIKD